MELSKRKLSPWFLLALLLLMAYVSFQVVGVFLNYVLTGLFIAYLTHPAYDWVHRKVRVPSVAAFIMVFTVSAILLIPLSWLTVELVGELQNILLTLDITNLQQTMDSLYASFLEAIGQEPPAEGEENAGFLDLVVPSLNAMISRFVSNLLEVVAQSVLGIFVMLYILYYGYVDGHQFVDNLRDLLPLQEAHRDLLIHEVGMVIQAVMYGHVLTAMIQAVLAGIGYAIFGVPNVVLWSAITFILALLPVVGPPIVWAPWGIFLIAQGEQFAGIGLLLYSAIMVSSLDNIIRPKLIGDRAHVHPAVVLVGVLGGIAVFGFVGIILGPLVLSIFVTILEVYRKEFMTRIDDGAPA